MALWPSIKSVILLTPMIEVATLLLATTRRHLYIAFMKLISADYLNDA
jgi:hypothetical protein